MDLVTPGLGLLFWQFVVFLIVLFVLSRYAWKPILGSLKEREVSIDEALQAAQQARAEMAALRADNEKLRKEALLERDKIIKSAQASSDHILTEARAKAQAEGTRILAETQAAIRNERHAAMDDMRREIVNLSVEIAEKMLKKQLQDPNAQKALASNLLQEVKMN